MPSLFPPFAKGGWGDFDSDKTSGTQTHWDAELNRSKNQSRLFSIVTHMTSNSLWDCRILWIHGRARDVAAHYLTTGGKRWFDPRLRNSGFPPRRQLTWSQWSPSWWKSLEIFPRWFDQRSVTTKSQAAHRFGAAQPTTARLGRLNLFSRFNFARAAWKTKKAALTMAYGCGYSNPDVQRMSISLWKRKIFRTNL